MKKKLLSLLLCTSMLEHLQLAVEAKPRKQTNQKKESLLHLLCGCLLSMKTQKETLRSFLPDGRKKIIVL